MSETNKTETIETMIDFDDLKHSLNHLQRFTKGFLNEFNQLNGVSNLTGEPSEIIVPEVFDKWKSALIDEVVASFVGTNFEEDIRAIENTMKMGAIEYITQGDGALFTPCYKFDDFDLGLSDNEEDELVYWVKDNKINAIKAILFGYKVKEDMFVVRLPDLDPENNYINYDLDEDCFDVGCEWESAWDNPKDDVYIDRFPMSVIKERLPKYVQYAEKV